MIEAAKELVEQGWEFRFEPDTQYVGVYHPNGGKQSILHFPSAERGRQMGEEIARFLNEQGKIEDG